MVDCITPKEISRRIAKFHYKAPQIKDTDHLAQVLRGFPADRRKAIYIEVRDILGFDSTYFPTVELQVLDLRDKTDEANPVLLPAKVLKLPKPRRTKE